MKSNNIGEDEHSSQAKNTNNIGGVKHGSGADKTHKVSAANKTDKPNINDNAHAIKNVNDIKIFKKYETNSNITNGKQGGDIGVKDNHIPFDNIISCLLVENRFCIRLLALPL